MRKYGQVRLLYFPRSVFFSYVHVKVFFPTKKPLLLNIKRFQQPQHTQLHPVDLNCMNKESKHIQ